MHFERFDLTTGDWGEELKRIPGQMFCHRPEWLSFLRQSQHGEPVAARLWDHGEVVGVFAGLIVNKFGVRILGSPFPGWTTSYMGVNIGDGVSLREAIRALVAFAFDELHCMHLEMMDRDLSLSDLDERRFRYRLFNSWEVDVHENEEDLIASFSRACRWNIHRASRNGLVVEEADDADFVDDYYTQLREIFARQRLVPTYSKLRVQQLISALRPTGQLLLLRARTADGEPAATGIFHPVDSRRAYAWGFTSSQRLRNLHPNELVVFHALNLLRERGYQMVDLAGSGDYKKKYHPRPIVVPWVRISKYPLIPPLRDAAQRSVLFRQSVLGRLSALAAHER